MLQHLPSEQFLKRRTDQFDRLYPEGASNGADHGDIGTPLHHGRAPSHQISGNVARHVIGHDGGTHDRKQIGDFVSPRDGWEIVDRSIRRPNGPGDGPPAARYLLESSEKDIQRIGHLPFL
jgi:hypothetical protein